MTYFLCVLFVTYTAVLTELSLLIKRQSGQWTTKEVLNVSVGGNAVNLKFQGLLKEVFGTKLVTHCQTEYTPVWLELMLQFEIVKTRASFKQGLD